MNIFDGGDMLMKIIFRNSVALLLVFTMIFTLGVSVLALDEDMTDEKVELSLEEDIGETINLEDEEAPEEELAPEEEADLEKELAPKEEAVPEEDLDQEDEVDQEELDPEAVVEPEPKPEEAKIEPEPDQAKEEPQKEEDSEKVEEAKELEEVEEEYDPGAMLDGFPAIKDDGKVSVPIIRYAPGSLGSALTSQLGFRPMSNGGELAPGEVRTSKTASPVDGMVNTWDIKVRIEGRDDQKVENTDVVLVIDRSGSMSDKVGEAPSWGQPDNRKTRMEYAQEAANAFIDAMLAADPNLRIAIVSFGTDVTVHGGSNPFSNNANTLKSRVNNLNANGGTFTQAGIVQARALLDGTSNIDNKYIVLLSDGQPTYSYQPSNWTSTYPGWGDQAWLGTYYYGIYDGNYTNTRRGNGSNLVSYYDGGLFQGPRRYVNNGLAAIRAGTDAKPGIDGIFTIAVNAGTVGTPILQQIASPGYDFSTSNPNDLNEIYSIIGTAIQTQNAIRNAVITDEMGDGFSLISNTIATTEGTTEVAPADSTNNETITWKIDSAVTQPVSGSDYIRFAEMTYRVEINDDILDIQGAKTNQDKLFETNKLTQLKYKDSDDQNIIKNITSPKVDPVLLKIKKILLDEKGNLITNDPRLFHVQIKEEAPNAFNHTENLVPNADYVWLTSLRHEGDYSVEEIGISGSGITDLDEFEISYNIDRIEKTNFLVNHIGSKPRGDVDIVVTNKLIPQTVDVTIKKEITGNFADLNRKFKFTVLVDGDEANPRIFELAHNESKTLDDIPKNAVLTLTEESDDYDVTVKVGQNTITPTNGKYTITLIGEDITIKVNNNRDEEIDTGITFDTLPYILILAVSTVGLGVGFVRKRNIRKED